MLKTRFVRLFAGAVAASALLIAQPKPKSQKEVDAFMAMQNAQDPDTRIKAANDLLSTFADTEFKPMALYFITSSYREKNDHTNTIVFGERVIEIDPKSAFGAHARVMIAAALAATTKEFDFDKEEKLGRADKMAKEAIEVLKTAPKFNPQIPDDQWEGIKKDYTAEAYNALGMSATVRKKWDDAITNFKLALETSTTPDPAATVRLASAYNNAGKYDDALTTLDKLLATPNLHPSIAQFAKAEKDKATKLKGGK